MCVRAAGLGSVLWPWGRTAATNWSHDQRERKPIHPSPHPAQAHSRQTSCLRSSAVAKDDQEQQRRRIRLTEGSRAPRVVRQHRRAHSRDRLGNRCRTQARMFQGLAGVRAFVQTTYFSTPTRRAHTDEGSRRRSPIPAALNPARSLPVLTACGVSSKIHLENACCPRRRCYQLSTRCGPRQASRARESALGPHRNRCSDWPVEHARRAQGRITAGSGRPQGCCQWLPSAETKPGTTVFAAWQSAVGSSSIHPSSQAPRLKAPSSPRGSLRQPIPGTARRVPYSRCRFKTDPESYQVLSGAGTSGLASTHGSTASLPRLRSRTDWPR